MCNAPSCPKASICTITLLQPPKGCQRPFSPKSSFALGDACFSWGHMVKSGWYRGVWTPAYSNIIKSSSRQGDLAEIAILGPLRQWNALIKFSLCTQVLLEVFTTLWQGGCRNMLELIMILRHDMTQCTPNIHATICLVKSIYSQMASEPLSHARSWMCTISLNLETKTNSEIWHSLPLLGYVTSPLQVGGCARVPSSNNPPKLLNWLFKALSSTFVWGGSWGAFVTSLKGEFRSPQQGDFSVHFLLGASGGFPRGTFCYIVSCTHPSTQRLFSFCLPDSPVSMTCRDLSATTLGYWQLFYNPLCRCYLVIILDPVHDSHNYRCHTIVRERVWVRSPRRHQDTPSQGELDLDASE